MQEEYIKEVKIIEKTEIEKEIELIRAITFFWPNLTPKILFLLRGLEYVCE